MSTRLYISAAAGLCAVLISAGAVTAQSGAIEAQTFSVDGVERAALVYRPAGPFAAPRPLVFVFHGGGGRPEEMRRLGFEPLADRDKVILVYPEGLGGHWVDGRDAPRVIAKAGGADDVGFVRVMIDELVASGEVDPAQITATGPSNGGFMSFRVACDLPVAAVAPVIAGMPEAYAPTCAPEAPVPVLMIAGDADRLVPFEGGFVNGQASRGRTMAIEASAAFWADANECAPTPARTELSDADPDDGTTTTLSIWAGCDGGAEVRLMRVRGGGHQWHGVPDTPVRSARLLRSGPVSRDFDGTETVWAFLHRFERIK